MNQPLAETVAGELGERACAIPVNVSDEESVANMVAQTVERYGGLDLMLANAGVVRSAGRGCALWLFPATLSCLRSLNCTSHFKGKELSWDDIVTQARSAAPLRSIIDTDSQEFYAGGGMVKKIQDYCAGTSGPGTRRRTGRSPPPSRGRAGPSGRSSPESSSPCRRRRRTLGCRCR